MPPSMGDEHVLLMPSRRCAVPADTKRMSTVTAEAIRRERSWRTSPARERFSHREEEFVPGKRLRQHFGTSQSARSGLRGAEPALESRRNDENRRAVSLLQRAHHRVRSAGIRYVCDDEARLVVRHRGLLRCADDAIPRLAQPTFDQAANEIVRFDENDVTG